MSTTKTITVFGSGKAEPGSERYILAHEVGRLIGEKGFTLANGGYGGTMEASALGCAKEAGEVVGVTCLAFGRSGANEYVSREIETSDLKSRLDKLVEIGHAYIVLPGATGTLLELAYVWELKNKKIMSDKPIVLLGDHWQGVVDCIRKEDALLCDALKVVSSPKEALDYICDFFKLAS